MEIVKPCEQSFDLPSAMIPAKRPSVLSRRPFSVTMVLVPPFRLANKKPHCFCGTESPVDENFSNVDGVFGRTPML